MEIIPGILGKEWSEIEKKIDLVLPFARTIHIDIIDGKFAPNTTFLDPKPFSKYSNQVFFELHMMVEEPINYLKPWSDVGFKRFLGHIEKMNSQEDFVRQGKLLGEIGLAIDGPTSLDQLKVPLLDLDCFLIMTINAGFSGQAFNNEFVQKVKTIREKSSTIPIEVDGGINDQSILQTSCCGASRFVSNSFIYNGNPKEQYEKLKGKLNDYGF